MSYVLALHSCHQEEVGEEVGTRRTVGHHSGREGKQGAACAPTRGSPRRAEK